MSSPDDIDALFVGFGNALRDAGLPIGTDDVLTFCAGMAELKVSDLLDVYWAGRACFVRRREHFPIYKIVFREYFLGEKLSDDGPLKRMLRSSANAGATLEIPNTEEGLPGRSTPTRSSSGTWPARRRCTATRSSPNALTQSSGRCAA
jgi:uncharacterized protein with von Willebrand factor type A (vWA) domain